MSSMRLDKYLSNSTSESRSRIKEILKNGRVKVNGIMVKNADTKVDPGNDEILMDSVRINYEEFRYFMLNKPEGSVSAVKDNLSDTVLDILAGENTKDLFPVGRLDKDSEGLLLITNDGALSHNLLSPSKHVDKEYEVILDKELSEEDRVLIENGIDIGDEKPTLPAKVLKRDNCHALITLHEGRFHQVKRMFAAAGYEVKYLKRIAMGSLKLDESLKPGEYRRLTEEEIRELGERR